MSAWISSAADCQRAACSSSPRISASRAPRSAATQHISFDEVKCFGSPRISQMPRSGSRHFFSIVSTWCFTIGQTRSSQVVARLRVQVHRVEQRAPHVVLVLAVRAVPDPHRPRALVAREVVERELGDLALAVDRVHDLEVLGARLRDVGDEVEEVVRLPVEPERVEAPQHERGVADPGVAVVPVALPARRLGQRRGGGRHERAGRRVRQPLQRERGALEVGAPRVVGERRRGRASAASGARSRRAARRPPRTSAAPGARTRTAPRTPCRPPSSASAPSRAGPRSPCSCRSSGAAPRRTPSARQTASW